jgi:hypothetical protein
MGLGWKRVCYVSVTRMPRPPGVVRVVVVVVVVIDFGMGGLIAGKG